jgi:phenylacetate-CoA ligase
VDEVSFRLPDLLVEAATRVPFYKERKPIGSIARLENWPLITGAELASEPLHRSGKLLNEAISCGSIFFSGGTSGAPKYALYTPQEIKRIGAMLAQGFLASGLRPGQKVVNLFVAGNLWSSFLAVDEALKNCGVFVLPMGGLAPIEEIICCFSTFRPEVAFGLPSLLVGYARHCEDRNLSVSVEQIFYAGEHLSPAAQLYLSEVWKTRSFHSAGYAAVDVGPIGWQCTHCLGGEHHLFAKDVYLEIIHGEAVVTSLVRHAMPVIRYRTGDKVEWLSGDCPCGSTDPRFILLGRLDDMINVWGCRVAFADLQASLLDAGVTASVMQVRVCDEVTGDGCVEKLIVNLEQDRISDNFFERFTERLFHHCSDLALIVDLNTVRQRIRVECVKPGSIPRVTRTGKVKIVVDERQATDP